jgi:hypothetical protein
MENVNKEWKSININLNQIETVTDKSVLINMPKKSTYADYRFWHPAKLVRRGRHSDAVSVSFTNKFKFNLFKNGKGRYNKYQILNKIEIDAEELQDIFKTTDENIRAKKGVKNV